MDSRILAAIGIIGVAGIAVFTFIMPSMTAGKVIEVEMFEFGYRLADGQFPIELKAGETYTFKTRNIGGVEHEIMIVKDPDRVLSDVKEMFNGFMEQGMSVEEAIEALEGVHHELEEQWEADGIFVDVLRLGPGESGELIVSIDEPGTYYMVCLVLRGSAPDTHMDRGMQAQIRVSQ